MIAIIHISSILLSFNSVIKVQRQTVFGVNIEMDKAQSMSFAQDISPQLSFIELTSTCDHDLLSEISTSDDIPEILAMLLLDDTLSSTLKLSIKKQLKMLQQK